ncbi:MAG: heavy-metal-associated domain-containing protein [Clostridiales bacterium]|nr:MAG: heavy-metal-associated domain-containing protein [Clostridiales bacterium]
MMCAHCVAHVKSALQKVDGVKDVEVSLENKTAVVTLTSDVSNDVLKSAVTNEGYEVVEIKLKKPPKKPLSHQKHKNFNATIFER